MKRRSAGTRSAAREAPRASLESGFRAWGRVSSSCRTAGRPGRQAGSASLRGRLSTGTPARRTRAGRCRFGWGRRTSDRTFPGPAPRGLRRKTGRRNPERPPETWGTGDGIDSLLVPFHEIEPGLPGELEPCAQIALRAAEQRDPEALVLKPGVGAPVAREIEGGFHGAVRLRGPAGEEFSAAFRLPVREFDAASRRERIGRARHDGAAVAAHRIAEERTVVRVPAAVLAVEVDEAAAAVAAHRGRGRSFDAEVELGNAGDAREPNAGIDGGVAGGGQRRGIVVGVGVAVEREPAA